MAIKQSAVTSEEVCTTQVAAQMLGISVSLVQQLVETGVLDAWKTQGGHRRIPLKAVLDYKNKLAGSMGREAGGRFGTRQGPRFVPAFTRIRLEGPRSGGPPATMRGSYEHQSRATGAWDCRLCHGNARVRRHIAFCEPFGIFRCLSPRDRRDAQWLSPADARGVLRLLGTGPFLRPPPLVRV